MNLPLLTDLTTTAPRSAPIRPTGASTGSVAGAFAEILASMRGPASTTTLSGVVGSPYEISVAAGEAAGLPGSVGSNSAVRTTEAVETSTTLENSESTGVLGALELGALYDGLVSDLGMGGPDGMTRAYRALEAAPAPVSTALLSALPGVPVEGATPTTGTAAGTLGTSGVSRTQPTEALSRLVSASLGRVALGLDGESGTRPSGLLQVAALPGAQSLLGAGSPDAMLAVALGETVLPGDMDKLNQFLQMLQGKSGDPGLQVKVHSEQSVGSAVRLAQQVSAVLHQADHTALSLGSVIGQESLSSGQSAHAMGSDAQSRPAASTQPLVLNPGSSQLAATAFASAGIRGSTLSDNVPGHATVRTGEATAFGATRYDLPSSPISQSQETGSGFGDSAHGGQGVIEASFGLVQDTGQVTAFTVTEPGSMAEGVTTAPDSRPRHDPIGTEGTSSVLPAQGEITTTQRQIEITRLGEAMSAAQGSRVTIGLPGLGEGASLEVHMRGRRIDTHISLPEGTMLDAAQASSGDLRSALQSRGLEPGALRVDAVTADAAALSADQGETLTLRGLSSLFGESRLGLNAFSEGRGDSENRGNRHNQDDLRDQRDHRERQSRQNKQDKPQK